MPITTSEDRIRRMKAAETQAGPWTGDTPIDSQDIRAGVRGVADDTPQDLKMPAQVETDSYNVQGKPRLPRGGYNVWDEGAKEGQGGYVPRAPGPKSQGGYIRSVSTADSGQQQPDRTTYTAAELGIDESKYGPGMEKQLQADHAQAQAKHETMLRHYDVQPVAGGGSRYVPNQLSKDQESDRRRNSYVNTMLKRWGPELEAKGITGKELGEQYDEGISSSQGGNRFAAGGRNASNTSIDGPTGVRNVRDQQVAQNVRKNWEQINKGRAWGVSRGQVQFFDTLQNAKTPEERANVLAMAHSANPNMGWGNLAGLVMKGGLETDQLNAWAQGQGAKPNKAAQVGADMRENAATPIDAATYATEGMQWDAANPGAAPDARTLGLQAAAQPRIQGLLKRHRSGQPLNDHERNYVRQHTHGMDRSAFATYLNLDPNGPETTPLYEQATGKPYEFSAIGNAWNAAMPSWLDYPR